MNTPGVLRLAISRIVRQIGSCRAGLRAVAGAQGDAVEFVSHQIHMAGINIQCRQCFGVGRLAHVLTYFLYAGGRQGQVLQPRFDAACATVCRLQKFYVAVELLGY